MVPETENGDVINGPSSSLNSAWLQDPIAIGRFTRFFYDTLAALEPDFPTAKKYIAEIKRLAGTDSTVNWDELVAELRMFNMETIPPAISAVTPTTTPLPGGNAVNNLITIDGDGFVQNRAASSIVAAINNTRVQIGPQWVVPSVLSGKKLVLVAPIMITSPQHTLVDVRVETPAGSVVLPAALEYV